MLTGEPLNLNTVQKYVILYMGPKWEPALFSQQVCHMQLDINT